MLFQRNFSEAEAEVGGVEGRGGPAVTAGLGQRLRRSISATHIAFKGDGPAQLLYLQGTKAK